MTENNFLNLVIIIIVHNLKIFYSHFQVMPMVSELVKLIQRDFTAEYQTILSGLAPEAASTLTSITA